MSCGCGILLMPSFTSGLNLDGSRGAALSPRDLPLPIPHARFRLAALAWLGVSLSSCESEATASDTDGESMS